MLDPTGRSSYGIGLCARCSKKFFLDELFSDPNSPGLMVCRDDLDQLDPYRLAARESEPINLEFVRPDVDLIGETTAPIFISSAVRVLEETDDYRVTDESDYREVTL